MADNKEIILEETTNQTDESTETVKTVEFEQEEVKEKEEAEKTSNPYKIIAIVAILVLIISIVGNGFLFSKKKALDSDVKSFQSQVTSVQDENVKLKDKNAVLTEQNQKLDNSLGETFKNMTAKDVLINNLNKENETLKQIETKLTEIQKLQGNMAASNNKMKQAIDDVNKTIQAKQQENQEFSNKLK